MDPIAVAKVLWRYKWYVLPALILTLTAALYVFQFGPRSYESNMSYAMVNPEVPTTVELEANPELENLNDDNPYLRSSDPALITDVLITRLSSGWVPRTLEAAGLGTDYTVSRGAGGNGFVIDITGIGSSEEQSIETTKALGELLVSELRTAQTVNDADETYLFTALVISSPDFAQEQFSSRLRSVIIVLLGGVVLVFAAVSLGRGVARREPRQHTDATIDAAASDPSSRVIRARQRRPIVHVPPSSSRDDANANRATPSRDDRDIDGDRFSRFRGPDTKNREKSLNP